MPAIANIVLSDAQATPVSHTFVPLGQQDNVNWFEDQSASSPLGYNRISISVKRAMSGTGRGVKEDGVCRVVIKVYTPKLETLASNDAGITPPPTIAYSLSSETTYLLAERSAKQDRKDLRKYTQFVNADALVVAAVEDLLMIF